jgi:transcriptional regulator with XRE-family HTH domain
MTVAETTRTIRKANKMSLDAFGAALAEQLPEYSFTKQAVFNWENGKTNPDFQFLLLCALRYGDWRRAWALDCMADLKPQFIAPNSVPHRIGQTESEYGETNQRSALANRG